MCWSNTRRNRNFNWHFKQTMLIFRPLSIWNKKFLFHCVLVQITAYRLPWQLCLNNLVTGYSFPMLYQTYDCLIDKPHKLYETTSTWEKLVHTCSVFLVAVVAVWQREPEVSRWDHRPAPAAPEAASLWHPLTHGTQSSLQNHHSPTHAAGPAIEMSRWRHKRLICSTLEVQIPPPWDSVDLC